MTKADRIYQRTEVGSRVLQDSGPVVRAETRWVLGLINADTPLDIIRNGMPRYSRAEVLQLLTELEAQGYIHSVEASTEHDLDFTGNLNLAALSAAHNAAAK